MAKVMTGGESALFLSKSVPVCKGIVAKKIDVASQFCKKNGFPVVLKILSKKALHKTEIGGVRVVSSADELQKEFDSLLKVAKAKKLPLDGILVQEHVSGKELLIGLKKDPTFGHVIVFGLGGVFVEVLKDVSCRVCPIDDRDAQEMIDELRGKALIYGVRGAKPLNVPLLIKTLVNVSKIPLKNPKITELDINPFILNDKEGFVVDARIVGG